MKSWFLAHHSASSASFLKCGNFVADIGQIPLSR
jgi:hypothetical protein